MSVNQNYTATLNNKLSQIPVVVEQLLAEIQKVLPFTSRERCGMCLALEEALTNAIIHGNLEVDSKLKDSMDDLYDRTVQERQQSSPFRERSVEIVGRFNHHQFVIEITDEGLGFDISKLPDPTQEDCLERLSGRGLFLMKHYMDEVSFNSKGNQVTLVKNVNVSTTVKADFEAETTAT